MTVQIDKTERFAVTWVKAHKGVQSAQPIENKPSDKKYRGFPYRAKGRDDASTDPVIGATTMCTRKFLAGEHSMILDVHEVVTDEAVIAAAAPVSAPKSEGGQRSDGNRDGKRRPDNRRNGKGNHQGQPSGNNRPVSQGDAAAGGKPAGEPRQQDQSGERRDQSQGGQRRDEQHKGQRRDGKPNRDQRNGGKPKGDKRSDNNRPRTWSFGPKSDQSTASKGNPITLAKLYVSFVPGGSIAMSDLGMYYAQVKAQSDSQATAIRTEMSEILARIAAFNEKSKGHEAVLADVTEKGRDLAEKLHSAIKLRQELKAGQKDLNSERLSALGRRSAAIKKAGDNADSEEVAAVEKLKAKFAERQAKLSAAVEENRVLIEGARETNGTGGLDWDVSREVYGLLPLDEAVAQREAVMKAVAELDANDKETVVSYTRLFALVGEYESLLNSPAS